jgi:uncharacterized protein
MAFIIVGIVVGIIFVFSVLTFFLSIHPPKYNEKRTPADLGINYENVEFKTSDGLTLKGWFIPSKNKDSKAVVIVGHGYPFSKSNVLGFAPFLHGEYNLFFIDFRYFGESEGKYTTVGWKEQEDMKAAIKYLKTRNGIDKDKIGAMGFSLSASTMLLTKSSDIKAIIADSPYASLDRMTKESYRIFPGFTKMPFAWMTKLLAKIFLGLNVSDVSPEKSIKNLDTPVLLIHGDRDSQISVENSKLIYDSSNKDITELWIVKGADHGQSYALSGNEYEQRILGFFDEHLSS